MPPDTPDPEVIRAALERMVASPQLETAPSLCRFLRYVVEETLAGRGGQIKEYCLGAEVFGRGDGFDPRVDPIVRVQARNLRGRMARYYEGPGASDPVRIEIPKRTYVPVFQVIEGAIPESSPPVPDSPRKHPVGRIVAAAIAIALAGGALTAPVRTAHRPHAPSSAAQEQYIRGRFLLDRSGEKPLRESIAAFDRAIAIDGQYAAAYAGLADGYNMLAQYGFIAPPDGMEKARAAAQKALALEPALAEGHVALAAVLEAYDWNWRGAEREYRKAIDLNATLAPAHLWYGMFLRDQGRLQEALPELRLAARLSPVSELTSVNFAYALLEQGNSTSALEQAELAAQLHPDSVVTQLLLANVYRSLSRNDEARQALDRAARAAQSDPHGLSAIAAVYTRNGRPVEAARLRARLEELARHRYVSPFDLANASLTAGDEDRALSLFEEAYRQRASGLIFLREKKFANTRQRARFESLVQRVRAG